MDGTRPPPLAPAPFFGRCATCQQGLEIESRGLNASASADVTIGECANACQVRRGLLKRCPPSEASLHSDRILTRISIASWSNSKTNVLRRT